ncbi:MAG: hypothetical protein BGO77_05765 [Caedibacter sp. 37-49]|nr:MAG: hypothetical protein BGO77_05765 [Caedibacter sp. 37-49]
MNDRPKLTIKKPLSPEKQFQLSQGLQYRTLNVPKKLSAKEQEHLMQDAQKKKREGIKTALGWLYEKFPACFNPKDLKPLKLKIDKDLYLLLKQEGAPSKSQLRDALAYYTRNIDYLKTVINGKHRYDLEGQQMQEITQDQIDFAQEKLEKILQAIKGKKSHKK